SATINLEIALRPWRENQPANYGVACGKSNLTVVDADHGLKDYTALRSWMEKHSLADTFIVQSGRDGEAGFHLYYRGAIRTTGFNLAGVTGELKSIGGYVVGAGSVHPSGKCYRI